MSRTVFGTSQLLIIKGYVDREILSDKIRRLPALLHGFCNPSVAAIEAVLNPEEGIDAYFFCTDKTGKFYFAETLAEHKENIAKAQEVNASLEESRESVK